MELIIDKYDSFTYNLYQYIGTLNPDVKVIRNDAITVDGIRKLQPDHLILSPGPGRPCDAGVCEPALRELKEELGVTAAPADLHECGLRRFRFEAEFHGKPFKDNQVSKVFCLWLDREAEDFAVQKSEIDYVKWFDLDEAVAAVEQGTIPNCIFPEELGMVKKFVGQTGGGC